MEPLVDISCTVRDELLGAYRISSVLAITGALLALITVFTFILFYQKLSQTLMVPVMWMQLSDVVVSLTHAVSFWPLAWSTDDHTLQTVEDKFEKDACSILNYYSLRSCQAIGVVSQFASSASISWYFVISWLTYRVLRGARYQELASGSMRRLQHVFVWGVAAVAAVIPLIDDKYGATDGRLNCWIHSRPPAYRALFYVPLGVYMAFALFVLIFLMTHYRQFFVTGGQRHVVARLALFVLAFCVLWMPALVNRVIYAYDGGVEKVPIGLRYFHILTLGLHALVNALVWLSSPQITRRWKERRAELATLTVRRGSAAASIEVDNTDVYTSMDSSERFGGSDDRF